MSLTFESIDTALFPAYPSLTISYCESLTVCLSSLSLSESVSVILATGEPPTLLTLSTVHMADVNLELWSFPGLFQFKSTGSRASEHPSPLQTISLGGNDEGGWALKQASSVEGASSEQSGTKERTEGGCSRWYHHRLPPGLLHCSRNHLLPLSVHQSLPVVAVASGFSGDSCILRLGTDRSDDGPAAAEDDRPHDDTPERCRNLLL